MIATEQPELQAGRARQAVAVVFGVHGLLFASWAAHIPLVKANLGVNNGELGLALLGAPVGSVSAIAAAAYLVPRLGSRAVVRIALLGYCVSGPFIGLAGEVWQLFLGLFAWGAFQGALDISMNTQAITVERARGRPLMNTMHACWGLGAFAGAGLGTASVALGISLAAQLSVLGLLTLMVAGGLTLRMLADSVHRPDVNASGDEPVRRRRRLSPAMIILGAIAFASMLCEGASADWSSVYLRGSLGASATVGGLAYTAFTLAMVTVRLVGDRLLERRAATTLLPLLTLIATVVFAVMLAIGTAAVAIVAFFVLGFGLGIIVPSAFSAAGRLPGVHPGVGVAVVSGLGWAGFVCGPPLIGQLANATSMPVALIVIPVLTAFIAIATRREKRLGAPRTPAS